MAKKTGLETHLKENKEMLSPQEEAEHIRSRRNQIAEIHEEIKQEKERQTELKAQVLAYNEILQQLGQRGNSQDQLAKMFEQYR